MHYVAVQNAAGREYINIQYSPTDNATFSIDGVSSRGVHDLDSGSTMSLVSYGTMDSGRRSTTDSTFSLHDRRHNDSSAFSR